MTSVRGSEPWYLAEGKEAQRLLEQGRSAEAVQRFESVLKGFGEEASYGRVVILERLGRALLLAGRQGDAIGRLRQALEVAGRLAPTSNVERLRCTLRSGLGDALRSAGRPAEARRAYLAALAIGKELNDPRSQGVDEARLGALALAEGDLPEARERYRSSLSRLQESHEPDLEAVAWHQLGGVFRQLHEWDEADRHYQEAARLRETQGDLAGADQSWSELIATLREAGRQEEAERWCRKAIESTRHLGPSLRLARHLMTLAELLREQPGRLAEAGRVAEQALAAAQSAEPTASEGWEVYRLLAEIHQALAVEGRPAAPAERIAAFRELARRAPSILATARKLGSSPGFGRAVILGRLGRCFCLGGRADLGAGYLRDAIAVAEQLPNGKEALELRGMLGADLAAAVRMQGTLEPETTDLRPSGPPEALPDVDPASLEVFLSEEVETDYAFDPDLLLDGPRGRTLRRCDDATEAVPDDARPVLAPGTSTWLGPEGWIHFRLSADEPRGP